MRLIDADALKKKATMRGSCLRPMVTAFQMAVTTHDIDAAPTIDAAPVVHARWQRRFIFNSCSECGFPFGVFDRWDYCPHCGAKMDQECDDNELC